MPKPTELLEIWYRRTATYRSDPDLAASHLVYTHVHVYTLRVDKYKSMIGDTTMLAKLDQAFSLMQGHNWSPGGEATPSLMRRGVRHTSMSVGDVVVMPDGGAWECTEDGWRNMGKIETVPTIAL